MARTVTTTASFSLSSSDLTSSPLNISASTQLNKAASKLGLKQTTGLAIKTTSSASAALITAEPLFRAETATQDGANKVYLKNLSTIGSEYFTIYLDQEVMGRLYAGDWLFMPWSAKQGTKETFVVTATLSSGAVAVGDSWDFDGVTTTSVDATLNNFAAAVNAQFYPNWTTTVSSAAVTFTARIAKAQGVVTGATAITGDTVVDLADSNFTMPITSGVAGTRSTGDLFMEPSVHTEMSIEHILIHE
tara:strand:+ start:479 stop:1219 length:741 start_codon:yes stop_codon:yes gene_type:complete